MNGTEEAVALIGVCIAVIGYFIKYRIDLKLAQRNDRLERINRQLSEFYGPLLALTRSSGQPGKRSGSDTGHQELSRSGRAIRHRPRKTRLRGGYG